MRIALIRRTIRPATGGAEGAVLGLARALIEAGHEVHLVAQNLDEASLPSGCQAHRLKVPGGLSVLKAAGFARAVSAFLYRHRGAFDVVQSFERTVGQDIYRAGDGCHREWLAQRSLVETPWKNFCIALNPLHLYYLSIERRIFASTPLIVAPAERTKREIMDHYRVAPERIRVVRTGVDRERFHPGLRDLHRDRVRRELGVPAEAPVAVFVGSGFHRKGLAWAIRALARLGSQGAYLLVAGRGEKGPYGRLAVEEGLGERVRLLGPRADVEALYGASDVFLLPTLYDPCSNATLEALASGLAVVTTEANGASEAVVPGRSGIVLRDPFDLEALARAVREALDLDRGELVRCSQEALGPYCWDKHREAMMACYEEVLRLKAAA